MCKEGSRVTLFLFVFLKIFTIDLLFTKKIFLKDTQNSNGNKNNLGKKKHWKNLNSEVMWHVRLFKRVVSLFTGEI